MKNLLLTATALLGFASATLAQVPNYVPTNGLVGWWPFNGNANDESGNGNNGTVNGATLTSDRFGNVSEAYSFDGMDDFIEVANNQLLTITGDLTMSAWVYSNGSNENNYQTIISKRETYWTTEFAMGLSYHTGIIHDTKLITARSLGMGNQEQTWSQTPYQSMTWEFWVVSYANGIASIYKNGVLDTTESFNLVPEPQNCPLLFGKNTLSDNSEQYFGNIDDIGIWNRALTQEEITALYTGETINPLICNPLPSNLQNGLVGYWPFCGNANDESGNGNNGTVNGATLTEDRFGNANTAYSFDGVDDFIEVPNSQLLTITGDLTMSAWVNSNGSNGSNYQTIVCKGASYWTWEYLMTLSYHTGIIHDTKFLTARALGMGNQEQTWSQTPYQPLEWEFWVATYANGLASIYKNGMLDTTESFSLVPEPQNSPLLFGKNTLGDNSVQYFGKIDDIGIWNRALSPEEVQQLYTADITSMNKPSSQPSIAFFPNPTQGQITIDFGGDALRPAHRVFVQTIQGQQIYSANIVEKTTTINLRDICGNGLYFVHVIDPQGNTIDIRKIVLQ